MSKTAYPLQNWRIRMSNKIVATLDNHFGDIEDPRRTYLNEHPLINILTIALCAIVAGAEGWTDVANFG
jgi:hypothetical protein